MLRIAVCDDEEQSLNNIVNLIKNVIDNRGISTYEIKTFLLGKRQAPCLQCI